MGWMNEGQSKGQQSCNIFKALERGRAPTARLKSGPADRLSTDLKRRHHNEPHITTSAEKPWRNPIIIT